MLFKISKDGIECISREFSTVVHKNYRAVAKCFVRGDGFYNVFNAVVLPVKRVNVPLYRIVVTAIYSICLLYTSDAADE